MTADWSPEQALALSLQIMMETSDWSRKRQEMQSFVHQLLEINKVVTRNLILEDRLRVEPPTMGFSTMASPLAVEGPEFMRQTTQPSSPLDQQDTPSGPVEPSSGCVHLQAKQLRYYGMAEDGWWCPTCGALSFGGSIHVPDADTTSLTSVNQESTPYALGQDPVLSESIQALGDLSSRDLSLIDIGAGSMLRAMHSWVESRMSVRGLRGS